MKTSARNVFEGKIASINLGAINDEITVALPCGQQVVATVTKASTKKLGLTEGREVIVLIKASFVILLDDIDGYLLSTRNVFPGTVTKVVRGQVAVEVDLMTKEGLELTSTITVPSADKLALKEGSAVTAVVKATTVVLGVKK